jgi:uncharacterized Zn finger protein
MPIVEFFCDKCKKLQEMILITKEEKDKDTFFCDKCGTVIKKVMSVPAKGIVK